MPHITFDAATARLFNRRPGSSHHLAYIDGDGSVCLWCQGKSPRGGVAVNLKAIEWLKGREGEKFVRVTNEHGGVDHIFPLAELPEKRPRSGQGGDYVFVDPEDIIDPDFGTPANFEPKPAPF